MNAASDIFQALWAMVNSVERRDIGEQYLCRTNVRRRFLTANVLLTRLHRHTQSRFLTAVDRHTDNPARNRTLKLVTGREKRCVWSAVAHRNTEALSRTEDHVRTHFTWRFTGDEAHEVGCNCD